MIKTLKHYNYLIKYFIYNIINIFLNNGSRKMKDYPNTILFVCDGSRNHGGIADRLKGILTTYYFAKKNNSLFFILWNSPFDLNIYLHPNSFDWRLKKKYKYCDNNNLSLILEMSKQDWKNKIKNFLFSRCLKNNNNFIVYTNLFNKKIPYSSLFFELFKPSKYLYKSINYHEQKIGGKYYSYTFRFGNTFNDFKDIVGIPLKYNQKIILLNKCINILKEFLNDQPIDYKALVTSDSIFFLQNIKNIDNRLYVIDDPIKHPEFNKNDNINREIWLKSFLDFYLIMKAEKVFQLKSKEMYKSGFPELAALIGEKSYCLYLF